MLFANASGSVILETVNRLLMSFGNVRMESFRNFVIHDWYVAIPMILMSMTGVTLVVWRLLLNSNGNTSMSSFLPKFQERLDKEGPEGGAPLL